VLLLAADKVSFHQPASSQSKPGAGQPGRKIRKIVAVTPLSENHCCAEMGMRCAVLLHVPEGKGNPLQPSESSQVNGKRGKMEDSGRISGGIASGADDRGKEGGAAFPFSPL
jgi:hypothetical protein